MIMTAGMARGARRGNSGFTLVEIMVAFFILAAVMGVVYSSVTASVYAVRYAEDRADIYHLGRQILSRLSREISSAYLEPGAHAYFRGEHDLVEGKRMDRMSFSTLAHRVPPVLVKGLSGSEHAVVAYYWKAEYPEGRDAVVTFFYREVTGFLAGAASGGDAPAGSEWELTNSLRELDIRYLQKTTGSWVDEWDSQAQGGLPGAVSISFLLADPSGAEIPFRTVVLPQITGRP